MKIFGYHAHHHDDPWKQAPPWAVELREMLSLLLIEEAIMAGELDSLTAQVNANTTVVQSALTLINGIAARIAAAGTDPAKLAALTTELKAQDDALAAAVAANTPTP